MKIKALQIISLFGILVLTSCGPEGSGNLTLKGSGSRSTSSSVLAQNFGFMDDVSTSSSDFQIAAANDPQYLNIKPYEFFVSSNADCSNAKKVFSNSGTPEYTNMLTTPGSEPILGRGNVPDGAYPCIIMVFSDVIKFKPTSGAPSPCVAGTEYSLEVCRSDGAGTLVDFPEGSAFSDTTCSTGEQPIPVYISTWSTSSGGGEGNSNAFAPPTSNGDSARGLRLTGVLNVNSTSNTESFFVVDGSGQVTGGNDACDMQPPTFSFQ